MDAYSLPLPLVVSTVYGGCLHRYISSSICSSLNEVENELINMLEQWTATQPTTRPKPFSKVRILPTESVLVRLALKRTFGVSSSMGCKSQKEDR